MWYLSTSELLCASSRVCHTHAPHSLYVSDRPQDDGREEREWYVGVDDGEELEEEEGGKVQKPRSPLWKEANNSLLEREKRRETAADGESKTEGR